MLYCHSFHKDDISVDGLLIPVLRYRANQVLNCHCCIHRNLATDYQQNRRSLHSDLQLESDEYSAHQVLQTMATDLDYYSTFSLERIYSFILLLQGNSRNYLTLREQDCTSIDLNLSKGFFYTLMDWQSNIDGVAKV